MALKAIIPNLLRCQGFGMRGKNQYLFCREGGPFFKYILLPLEISTSCRILQQKNPLDPWTNQGPIPLPDKEKMNKLVHYDNEILPGNEDWHTPITQPFSGTF